jgi:hypothetical protein
MAMRWTCWSMRTCTTSASIAVGGKVIFILPCIFH